MARRVGLFSNCVFSITEYSGSRTTAPRVSSKTSEQCGLFAVKKKIKETHHMLKLKTASLIAIAAAAGLALAGCSTAGGDTDASEEASETAELAAAVSTVCTTEGGAEFNILDFETSWNFSSPGDAIASCDSEVLLDGVLTEEQAAAGEVLGTEDIAEIAPLYAVCAHPTFGDIDPAEATEEEQTQLNAALEICADHPLADEVAAQ